MLCYAQDDTSGDSLLRLMHVEADNTDEQNCRDIMKTTEGRSIGGERDKSAPMGIPVIGHDQDR